MLAEHDRQPASSRCANGHIPSSRCPFRRERGLAPHRCKPVSVLRTSAPLPLKGAGGAGRDRTDDLMLAKHALSQLSYSPNRGSPLRGMRAP